MALDPITDSSGNIPPPVMGGMGFKDVGSTGLRQYAGYVREEFLRQLYGQQARRVYREMMDNSATIGAMLFSVVQSMRKIDWRTEPASDKPEAIQEAEFAESLRNDMSHSWSDLITEALSMLPFGFSVHETVYKRRNGPQPLRSQLAGSAYDDGRIGWRRLPIRGQETVLKWFFDQNGETVGMTQQPYMGSLIDIPAEKFLLFRPSMHKNNPEGRSILRNAYRAYYMQTKLEDQEAVLFERMAGLPVVRVPLDLMLTAARTDNSKDAQDAQTSLEMYKKIATNVRIDEQMGIVIPSDVFESSNGTLSTVPMYSFELLAPQASRSNVSADKSIERYKLDQLMTILADFIEVGHGQRGTQSLAISKVDMFFQAVEGWLGSIADVINRHGLTRIWALNGLDRALMPQYISDLAQRIDLDSLGNFILHLAQGGAQLFPDEDLENWLRDAAGMPDITDARAYTTSAVNTMGSEGVKKALMAAVAKRIKEIRSSQ